MVRKRMQFLIGLTAAVFLCSLLIPGVSTAQFEGTARDYYGLAEEAAIVWHSDAELLYLFGTGEEMHVAGETILWTYLFESASDDSILMVAVSGVFVVLNQEIGDTISLMEPLPTNWVDSDDAIAVAETHGGSEFRSISGSDLIVATAGRGFYVPQIERPVWFFSYLDTTVTGHNLYLYVDAATGEFIDSLWLDIDDMPEGAGGVPKGFTLSENYPNPFNPSTTLRYTVPAGNARKLTIEVFDIRGRRLRTLFEGVKAPGIYKVHWDGRDHRGREAGSGIYLVRLRAGSDTALRKMVLLK